ncbi:isopentenyl-diphosphate Delta-isomerase [Candidatus Woesebacteria bacterium]|nr:isopentenyl-diphosphate Delta-isomerase [Candidatus Woesebacteria bacterium]
MMTNSLDQVTLVNEKDEVIGSMDKVEAHRGEGKLHRAISVFLFNDKDELLIQQRSAEKIVGAHQWANTCCGNVRPAESYLECATRRLAEELGVTGVTLTPITKFIYKVRCNDEFSEYEVDTVFIGTYEGMVIPNAKEVQAYRWINKKEFGRRMEHQLLSFAPWVPFLLHQPEVKGKLYAS